MFTLLYRVGKAALDTAQANHHIIARRDTRRCLTRILIGKRADIFVGVDGLYGIGHLIDKPDEQARMTAILLLKGAALIALTHKLMVVLRERIYPIIGVVGDDLLHSLLANL